MRRLLAIAMMMAFSATANAHIPARCDPVIDRFVEAEASRNHTLDEYGAWLEDRKDRVYHLTPDEAADLVRMIRDRDIAEMELNRAMISLFKCIG